MLKVLAILIFFFAHSSIALADRCPQKIGVLVNTEKYLMKLTKDFTLIYKKLGCEVGLVHIPYRRGIKAFNAGDVDGEMLRFTVVEGEYTVPFIRSEPLFKLTLGKWGREKSQRKTIGYVRGVIWSEKVASELVANGEHTRGFNDYLTLFEAYQRGAISSFLTEDVSIKEYRIFNADEYQLLVSYSKEYIYHYLSSKYSDFMLDFNSYLQKEQPFGWLNK